jgi:hypothetical protein
MWATRPSPVCSGEAKGDARMVVAANPTVVDVEKASTLAFAEGKPESVAKPAAG